MDPALATRPHPSHTGERRLYAAAAVVALALVFAGFARTYYLRSAFDGPPLTLLLYVHGAVMTSRSEEHTSELQSLLRIPYAVFCLKKKNNNNTQQYIREQ